MLNHFNLHDFRRECIDTRKVYDYILNKKKQCFNDVTFMFPSGTNFTGADTIEVVSCQIVPEGATINTIPSQTSCEEIGDTRPVVEYELPSGEVVPLQIVSVDKTVTLAVTIRRTNENLGTQTIVGVSEPLEFDCEEVIMCAPEGTDIMCMFTDSSRCIVYNLDPDLGSAGNDTATGTANVFACQTVQAYADVKFEVLARFCQPRNQIKVNVSKAPTTPERNKIFPNNTDSNGCS